MCTDTRKLMRVHNRDNRAPINWYKKIAQQIVIHRFNERSNEVETHSSETRSYQLGTIMQVCGQDVTYKRLERAVQTGLPPHNSLHFTPSRSMRIRVSAFVRTALSSVLVSSFLTATHSRPLFTSCSLSICPILL
jgi:hypothetical protein